jgi:hypothetical protein
MKIIGLFMLLGFHMGASSESVSPADCEAALSGDSSFAWSRGQVHYFWRLDIKDLEWFHKLFGAVTSEKLVVAEKQGRVFVRLAGQWNDISGQPVQIIGARDFFGRDDLFPLQYTTSKFEEGHTLVFDFDYFGRRKLRITVISDGKTTEVLEARSSTEMAM